MAETKMPDVTGKGPSLMREMLAIFKETADQLNGLSPEAAARIKALFEEKGSEIESLLGRAYMKTVKAGEVAWQCKELAKQIQEQIAANNESEVLALAEQLDKELGGLIHTTKTFVIRMT